MYDHRATLNLDDGWIRFWPDSRLSEDDYRLVTQTIGIHWKRAEQCFAGPWTTQKEDQLKEHFGVELESDDTDLLQVAQERADYYRSYSENAAERSRNHHAISNSAVAMIPFGQPILVGHHSERAHRQAIAKARNHATKAYQESDRADYWSYRSQAAIDRVQRKYRPMALKNRITSLTADMRRLEGRLKELDDFDLFRQYLKEKSPEREEALAGTLRVPQTEEGRAQERARIMRWLDFTSARLDVAEALYEASDKMPEDRADRPHLEPGGGVRLEAGYWSGLGRVSGAGWYQIHRVHKKTVVLQDADGVLGSGILGKIDISVALTAEQIITAADWLEMFGERPTYTQTGEVISKEQWAKIPNDYKHIDGNGQRWWYKRVGHHIKVVVQ